MKKRSIRLTALVLLAVLCLGLLAGCGKKDAAAEAKAKESEFLLGSWTAEKASYKGEEKDPYDVFGGYFMLYFSKDGTGTMSIDQQRALVKWELTEEGVTLKGDDTYQITFPDESKKSLIIVIKGVEVLMEKFED